MGGIVQRIVGALTGAKARAEAEKPHFQRDYERHVRNLKESHPLDEAMSLAVGGHYDIQGRIHLELLRSLGLKDGDSLIDLGCGSGRTARQLAASGSYSYLGIDVVEDLIDYARAHTPADYRFHISTDLKIPAADASADIVTSFSLFTHLLHEETYLYMEEVRRVLRPGGTFLFSFLEFGSRDHFSVFAGSVEQQRNGTKPVLNMFIERNVIELWAKKLGFAVETYIDGNREIVPGGGLGQTGAVLRRLER
ncbi:class I SAM-dependent methyltransferase [Stappia indica]|uniref:Methyltransferase domain-containing protein n=1 Tax=Stappia indica TaxID=538381 RepID=A0A857CD50_9HYPH|nr:class I SAM-dependent methyltransferase [Stappia indica]QGZ37003.1 methyltransferase domain-containing protein [Stappia indica]